MKNIGLADLLTLIAVFSFSASIYGFLYVVTYYGEFGIDTGQFFSLTDYLTVSANKLYILVFIILYFSIFVSFVYLHPRNDSSSFSYHAWLTNKLARYFWKSLLFLILFAPSWYPFDETVSLIPMYLFVFWAVNEKMNYKKRFRFYLLCYFLIIIGSWVTFLAVYEARRVKINDPAMVIEFSEQVFIGQTAARFIGSNSQYVFMLSEKGESTFVISRDKVKSLRAFKSRWIF